MREFIGILLLPLAIAALGLLAFLATPSPESGARAAENLAAPIGASARAEQR
jgi:hypothetical protein